MATGPHDIGGNFARFVFTPGNEIGFRLVHNAGGHWSFERLVAAPPPRRGWEEILDRLTYDPVGDVLAGIAVQNDTDYMVVVKQSADRAEGLMARGPLPTPAVARDSGGGATGQEHRSQAVPIADRRGR